MAHVRFLRHAPPFMPGDVAAFADDVALAMEAKGIVEVLPTPPAAPPRPERPPQGKS